MMRKLIDRFRPLTDNLIWISVEFIFLYLLLGSVPYWLFGNLLVFLTTDASSAVIFVTDNYTAVLSDVILLLAVCLVVRKNRFVLRAFLPRGRELALSGRVVEDTYEPTHENTVRILLAGLFLGFLENSACALCAVVHGDIKLYPDPASSMLPVLIYAFFAVLIQSGAEEFWCRGFLYERVCIRYPVWVAVLMNGVLFALLHVMNDGVSVLGIAGIFAFGISIALVRWYTGSIWFAVGYHTMWNFTQNFIFGLPNSGLVSEASLFRLDAMNAVSSWAYDYEFGLEGGVPAPVIDIAIAVVILLLAKRSGRLGELKLSYRKRAALAEEPDTETDCS